MWEATFPPAGEALVQITEIFREELALDLQHPGLHPLDPDLRNNNLKEARRRIMNRDLKLGSLLQGTPFLPLLMRYYEIKIKTPENLVFSSYA